ncbi:MAG: hypothetical protein QM762_08780 [Chryseolinea sp.]
MKYWEDFLPDVLPQCPGCPDIVAEAEIRNAAEEFLAESRAWRYWVLGVVAEDGISEYQLLLPVNTRAVKLHEATLNGEPLKIQPIYAGETACAYKATMADTMGWVKVGPTAPAADLLMNFRVSLAPTSASTGIADDLFDTYRLGIAHGAVARLCDMTDKPYSNPGKAVDKRTQFEAAISTARAEKAKGNSSYKPRTTAVYF